jgi:hypothetical protein
MRDEPMRDEPMRAEPMNDERMFAAKNTTRRVERNARRVPVVQRAGH